MIKECKACGRIHSIVESLAPHCLAFIRPKTEEEIIAALEKGRKNREDFEKAHPTKPGYFK